MQGGEGPLPKGSVGDSQRTLEPCRGLAGAKDKKRIAGKEQRPSRNTRAAPKKVIGTQAGLPARPFISLCESGKSWGKIRDNGNTFGFVSGV